MFTTIDLLIRRRDQVQGQGTITIEDDGITLGGTFFQNINGVSNRLDFDQGCIAAD
ncbi:hypothetical protein [uncultured Litoreibacter sp.]|uniref:hypothetical protein n=1 Tax=uncultured Litoreibacter sp. TaxID=1392394 RepID=UPI00262B1A5C|nr:hypothetical protein [uncultured Litoreibacter sp.]